VDNSVGAQLSPTVIVVPCGRNSKKIHALGYFLAPAGRAVAQWLGIASNAHETTKKLRD
jgi:hypothetical protein